ncbi:hypothetical protein BCR35DRAFT_355671 [Leucosporidium creatinivorum]|uniref:Uncharacterized protein n=1 Tax=Leucosporidium creatinivorum TaxID=106004 RepID=A0A1Y2D9L5_9BASI|nr:hypothetical protein BCR35DRAFT_355671 [Leucosporidium creatinivorum]
MSDEANPLLSQLESDQIIGPVLLGAMVQIALFGFTISHLINLRSTQTWIRSSGGTRAICWAVMLLNTAFTGMIAHDIWHYGTLPQRGIYDIIAGTLVQAVEPILLGVVALIVQLTLGWRSSRIIQRPRLRWGYFVFVGTLSVISFLACIGVTIESVWFHRGRYDSFAGLSFTSYLGLWMWGECLTDLVITVTYLILLRRRLWGQNEIVDSTVQLIFRLMVRSAAYTTLFAMLAAVMAQAFPELPYYDLLYTFCNPLPSLYTLSLFTTLSIGETVQKTLGSNVSQFQASHASTGHLSAGAAPLGVTQIPTRPISVRVDSNYGQVPDEGKAFEWARGPSSRDDSL